MSLMSGFAAASMLSIGFFGWPFPLFGFIVSGIADSYPV
jgi:hypothetical protein